MRRFVLVTAVKSQKGAVDISCAGIRKLKRGVTLPQFVLDYVAEIGDTGPSEMLRRGDTYTLVAMKDDILYTWNFTMYEEEDLMRAVSNLTRDELLRDLKELLPLKDIVR